MPKQQAGVEMSVDLRELREMKSGQLENFRHGFPWDRLIGEGSTRSACQHGLRYTHFRHGYFLFWLC